MATDNGPQAPELGPRPMSPLIGRQHFDTLEDLVLAGMTPMDALMAATKRGAEAFAAVKRADARRRGGRGRTRSDRVFE